MLRTILFRTGLELANKSPDGAEVVRLYALKLWRDALAPGSHIEYLHNTTNTQTFAAIGFPEGYFKSVVTENPTTKSDLHSLKAYSDGASFESIDLENDPGFKALFANYLESNPDTASSRPKIKL